MVFSTWSRPTSPTSVGSISKYAQAHLSVVPLTAACTPPDGDCSGANGVYRSCLAGIVNIPTSVDELLAEIASIKWNTFTLDDVGSVLTSFDFAENTAVYLFIFIVTALDLGSIFFLGFFRGHRKKVVREREVRAPMQTQSQHGLV